MLGRGWGRVINVASICAQISTRNIRGRHYETAKAALVGFTRAVAADWAPHGVTVNAIAPGGFMTDANRRWFREKPELRQVFEGQVPMGRLGEPGEIGRARRRLGECRERLLVQEDFAINAYRVLDCKPGELVAKRHAVEHGLEHAGCEAFLERFDLLAHKGT